MSSETNLISLEELLARKKKADAKLLKFQERTFSASSPEKLKDVLPIYDLYLVDEMMYLIIDVPGVFEKDLSIQLNLPYF